MCGICGFVGENNIDILQNMMASMQHRGPDAQGVWSHPGENVNLGHKRLSIVDLGSGSQPMQTKDHSLIVSFNGEIYNHLDLRNELTNRGHTFQTHHSDTEVLLHGYTEWGESLPQHLNGMWAFAIYDRRNGNIFISRDRFGEKPLFYTKRKGIFVFASELTAILKHPAVIPATISKLSLQKYFAYGFIPAPSTLYEGIYKLPAGNSLLLSVADVRFTIKKYWDFCIEPAETIPARAEEEWGEKLRELLHRAVQRRLMSDVPLGVFLSGGVDSSSITAMASQSCTGMQLKTFSIGFQEASFDETVYAKNISQLFHTKHHETIFSVKKMHEIIPDILHKLDEPMGDSSLLPTFLLCQETRKYVTVSLSGDGGDELFAGYDPFRALRLAKLYNTIVPYQLHKAIRLAIAHLPTSHRNMSFGFRAKRALRGLSYPKELWNPIWLGPLEPKDISELFGEKINIEEVYAEAIETWDSCLSATEVDKTLQFYTKLYLQDDILVKSDRASMMNSLEVRAPFLDIELVDFVRTIPSSYKFRNGVTKYILKKALEPILPKDILYRPKKGFGVPIGKWFKDGSIAVHKNCLPKFLNTDYIGKLINEHLSGAADQKSFLWNCLLLENMSI